MRRRLAALALIVTASPALGQQPAAATDAAVPDLAHLVARPASELRDVVERFNADRWALARRWDAAGSPARRARFQRFFGGWQGELRRVDFERLGQEGRIDSVLLDNRLRYELELLEREAALAGEMAAYVPFAPRLLALQEQRRDLKSVEAAAAARALTETAQQIDELRKALDTPGKAASLPEARRRIVAHRAASALDGVRRTLESWYGFYTGYDPLFTWWVAEPYKKTDEALKAYAKALREKVVGWPEGGEEPIVGTPIGAAGLAGDLRFEMIAYSPEELIRIAEREFAWCEAEMRRAARDMGFGDDWKAALEKVKTLHVEPGKQTDVARDLAREAVAFVRERGLVTIPPLAEEVWRMEMLSPAEQKVAPFFLGGEVIRVSFPTDAMAYEDKLMSMRGNNIHFSRATVHHELIPGHHLQGFMSARYDSHRGEVFSTPFWSEGGALYWEMVLWDAGFPRTPEDRVGMLFWRMHRAARIIFSLGFHLGTMTPQQAIDFLVDRVGHERANATAEVRRSFNGSYSPLYQIAYMIGGLQLRALHKELVGSGKLTDRQFHDAILEGGNMPIEMVRARLAGTPLARDYRPSWRFAGEFRGKAAAP